MSARSRWLRYSVGLFSLSLFLTACGTLPVDTMRECVENCKPRGNVCHKPTMMSLARDLDHLERHIESHGSIVIQKPAVWGQARLTQYRQEFEEVMRPEKDNFSETLQGSISRSDQAYFMNSLALSAAVSGEAAVQTVPKGTTDKDGKIIQQQIITPVPVADLPKFVGDSANPPAFFSSAATGPKVDFKGTGTDKKLQISLEPTLYLEQKTRYLNYLHQIRRTNEGDDTTDAPGYALHLMRIPVSVLPGKCTQAGHGAEVTLSLTPSLGDELLPVTFRNLVSNDLLDQISKTLIGFLNSADAPEFFRPEVNEDALKDFVFGFGETPIQTVSAIGDDQPMIQKDKVQPRGNEKSVRELYAAQKLKTMQSLMTKYSSRSLPSTGGSQGSRLPFPSSQIYDNFGTTYAYRVAYEAYLAVRKDIGQRDLIHLQDLQSYLKEEVTAAQRFLSTDQNQSLWTLCSRDLAEAVRNRQIDQIKIIRDTYRKLIHDSVILQSKTDAQEKRKHVELSTTAALGWAILVNSALLNEQLNQDIREVASAKGIACRTDWLPFYLPNPPAEARAAFNDYVRQRWPIHVFALDPTTQDQNLADTFSTRREMQLALSMAFASGRINAQQMTRFARRIEAQYDTIAINRTSVGFSHGDDTFGWRFYPRFQTPDIESNLTVLTRDLLSGGPNRNQLLNQRKLEPGIRECVAIVLMPAFVPYVNCDVSTHWFKLTNPKHMSGDSTEALKLSRQVKSMQVCAGNVRDADCYRDGDFMRLLRKVDQLSARLPLQTHQFQVPYENTIGGFQMFNTGVTDLAPELDGWYGAPGISTKTATTLFLVGRNLSVRNTQVVAGGRRVTNVELLSRQVIRVEIPSNIEVKKDRDGRLNVDIHVATPYGVTQHLQVPTTVDAAPAQSGFSIVGASADQRAGVTYDKDNKVSEVKLSPTGITFSITNQSLAPFAAELAEAKLKWSLTGISSSGAEVNFKESTVGTTVTFTNKLGPVTLNSVQAKVTELLVGAMTKEQDIRRIIARGVLEITVTQGSATSVIRITLDNPLVWFVAENK